MSTKGKFLEKKKGGSTSQSMVDQSIFSTNENPDSMLQTIERTQRQKTRTGSGALSMASEAFALSMSNPY